MADCGLRRIVALTSLGRIADCTSGTLRCKDASRRQPKECEPAVAGILDGGYLRWEAYPKASQDSDVSISRMSGCSTYVGTLDSHWKGWR
eukprot:11924095-Alexandrium_andersonii.AAC.1